MNEEPQPWEYRSRSVGQRLPIIIGGVLVNFILAMVIYAAVLFTWGKDYLPLNNAKYGMEFSGVMLENGFKNGDNVVKIDGQAVELRAQVVEKILIEGKRDVTVSRDNQLVDLTLPVDFAQKVLASHDNNLVDIRYPFVIGQVDEATPAKNAGLMNGDSIIGINGKQLSIYQDIVKELDASRSTLIDVSYVRKGIVMQSKVQLDATAKLGVIALSPYVFMPLKHISYGFLESVPAGINLGWETLTSYVKQFKLVFTKEGSKQLGGFGSIGKMFPKTWDWQSFWALTALLSVILAFMNFLPIPALDGGYVLFLIYELITRKKPNEKFLEYAQTVGMMLLFGLLLFANGNDLFKAIFR